MSRGNGVGMKFRETILDESYWDLCDAGRGETFSPVYNESHQARGEEISLTNISPSYPHLLFFFVCGLFG